MTSYIRALMLAVLIVIFSQVFSSKALALIPGEGTSVFPNNGSIVPWLVVTAPGTNGMNGPQSQTYAYWPVSAGTAQVTIKSACDTDVHDDNGGANDTLFQVDIVQSITIISGTAGTKTDGGFGVASQISNISCTDITFRVNPLNASYASTDRVVIDGVSYYRVTITGVKRIDSSTYYVNRYSLSINNNGLLGYVANKNPAAPSGYTGIAYDKSSTGWGWSTSIAFATPCNYTGTDTTQPVRFFDTDHINASTSTSPFWQDLNHTMDYNVYRYDRRTRSKDPTFIFPAPQAPRINYLSGGNNAEDRTGSFSLSPNYVYVIVISNINYVNSIQVALPFEQIYANDDCNTAPSGSINATCTNGTVTLNYVDVTDREGGTMSIRANSSTGALAPFSITGSGNVPPLTGGRINFNAPNSFSSVQDGAVKRVTGTLVDGEKTASIAGTYVCPRPTVAACSIDSITTESGVPVVPTYTISNGGAITADVYITLAVAGKTWTSNEPSKSVAVGAAPSYPASSSITFTALEEKNWAIEGTLKKSADNTVVSTCSNLIKVVRKPIFSASRNTNIGITYGGKGDISVGGSYDSSCSPESPGNLYGWANQTISGGVSTVSGSNASFAAKVLGTAKEFYSGSSISSATKKLLTLSNEVGDWGGGFGKGTCLKSLYETLDTANAPVYNTGSYEVSTLYNASGVKRQIEVNGPLTLTNAFGSILPAGNYFSMYVNGDVYITSNITMATTYGASQSSIPFLSLVVKGNIYIAPTVTRLDGVYIAQPNNGSGGTIYTCAKGAFSAYSSDEVRLNANNYYTNCSSSIVFNGIIQAKELKLHRVNGTLRTPNIKAETFNILPELYFARNPFVDTNPNSIKYDSASLLPPLL